MKLMLIIENLSGEFIKDISFTVNKGDIFNVLGPNGAGKTSLARLIMGLEKKKSGKILFNNKDLSNLSVDKRAKKGIGYIFQNIPTYTHVKVKDYFEAFVIVDKKAIKMFEMFGMNWEDYKNRIFDNSLSGGERKKIEIIINLLLDKQLYILDEVDSGLDSYSVKALSEIVMKINKRGTTFIIISHNKFFQEISKKGLVMCNGELMKLGTIKKIMDYYDTRCNDCIKFNS